MNPFEIIYADDDLEDLDLFAEAVNNLVESKIARITLTVFNSGNALLAQSSQLPKENNIIFLDINMPGKNGFEVLEELRKNNQFKNVPVLIYSTSSDQKTIEMSYHLGANAYLVKPDSFVDLQSLILKVLGTDWKKHNPDLSAFVLNPQGKRV